MGRASKRNENEMTQPPKKRRLSELRGILPATKPYIGVEATRQHVAQQLGEELERKLRKR
jgi:hypothetical protein